MIPVSLPDPIDTQPRHFTYLVFAICLLGATYIAERVNYWTGYWDLGAPGVFGDEPVPLSIGNAAFEIPLTYVATARQRHLAQNRDAGFDKLRLEMTWPSLEPALYRGSSDTRDMIRLDVEYNPGRESLRARLDPFYRRLARGGELIGPDGLRILTLSARRSAQKDLIVYDPSTRNGFIARCLREPSTGRATCHRALLLASGLELRYRFDQSLLPQWRSLDDAIIGKVEGFRVN